MNPTVESMSGFDPFDALRGTRVPGFVRAWPRARQIVIQLRKRSAWDLGPLLGVRPFLMAKTVGAFLAAEARQVAAGVPAAAPEAIASVLLGDSTVARHDDGSWGYEFDVQTRWAFYPAGSANLISTYFCARGLGEAGLACEVPQWHARMLAGARFVDERLRTQQGWFRYTVDSDVLVHNANLLGAGLVAAAASLTGDGVMLERALEAASVTIASQRPDGSWPYGRRGDLDWCDNFHTAYNLDGLLIAWLASGDTGVASSLRRGTEYWMSTFFEADGAPRYFSDSAKPYDVHCAGTAIDVASRLAACGFGGGDLARNVAAWTRSHLSLLTGRPSTSGRSAGWTGVTS